MSESQIVVLVVLAGLGTYLIRMSFLLILGSRVVSPAVENVLRYIPPAAFAALIFPAVLSPQGELHIGLDNLKLIAALMALIVGLKTRNVLWVIASGMAALWLLTIATA